jgi:hypothetical protein
MQLEAWVPKTQCPDININLASIAQLLQMAPYNELLVNLSTKSQIGVDFILTLNYVYNNKKEGVIYN